MNGPLSKRAVSYTLGKQGLVVFEQGSRRTRMISVCRRDKRNPFSLSPIACQKLISRENQVPDLLTQSFSAAKQQFDHTSPARICGLDSPGHCFRQREQMRDRHIRSILSADFLRGTK